MACQICHRKKNGEVGGVFLIWELAFVSITIINVEIGPTGMRETRGTPPHFWLLYMWCIKISKMGAWFDNDMHKGSESRSRTTAYIWDKSRLLHFAFHYNNKNNKKRLFVFRFEELIWFNFKLFMENIKVANSWY